MPPSFGLGAYVSAIMTQVWQVPYWPSFLCAGILAALVGIPLGAPALPGERSFSGRGHLWLWGSVQIHRLESGYYRGTRRVTRIGQPFHWSQLQRSRRHREGGVHCGGARALFIVGLSLPPGRAIPGRPCLCRHPGGRDRSGGHGSEYRLSQVVRPLSSRLFSPVWQGVCSPITCLLSVPICSVPVNPL